MHNLVRDSENLMMAFHWFMHSVNLAATDLILALPIYHFERNRLHPQEVGYGHRPD